MQRNGVRPHILNEEDEDGLIQRIEDPFQLMIEEDHRMRRNGVPPGIMNEDDENVVRQINAEHFQMMNNFLMPRNVVRPHIMNEQDENVLMRRNGVPPGIMNEDDEDGLRQRNAEHFQMMNDNFWVQQDRAPPVMNRNNRMLRNREHAQIVFPYIGYAHGALPDPRQPIWDILGEVIACCATTLTLIPLLRKFDFATLCADSILRSLLMFLTYNEPGGSLAILALDLAMVIVIYNPQGWAYDCILAILVYLAIRIVTDSASHILSAKIRDFFFVFLFNAPHAMVVWISYIKIGYYFFQDNRFRTVMDILTALLYFSVCYHFINNGILSLVSMFVGTVACILYKAIMSYLLDEPMFNAI